MKEYVCTICGYIHKGELPSEFRCPVCGAGRDAFTEIMPKEQSESTDIARPDIRGELSAMELSVICSNLARGCEKQYKPEEMAHFLKLSEFFRAEAEKEGADINALKELLEKDLNEGFPYARKAAELAGDRGAMRSLVWSEKVTRMLKSLLGRYNDTDEKKSAGTGIYMCTVCGFVYTGDAPPETCPVCKVPSWKFERQKRREQ